MIYTVIKSVVRKPAEILLTTNRIDFAASKITEDISKFVKPFAKYGYCLMFTDSSRRKKPIGIIFVEESKRAGKVFNETFHAQYSSIECDILSRLVNGNAAAIFITEDKVMFPSPLASYTIV